MTTEITKIDPKEFGLEENKALTIQTAFEVKIAEREALANVYQNVITKEITPELVNEANELRKKLVKVRTGIAEVHKTEKAFYLAAGKFCDALKNKHTLPVTQMEEKLQEIVDYYENIERERLAKLRADRWSEISQYTEHEPRGLEEMEVEVFEAFKSGLIAQYEAKIEAEKKAEAERLEAERKQKLHNERSVLIAPYAQFITQSYNLGEMNQADFDALIVELKNAKIAYEKEQAEIRAENERLRKEAEAKEKALALEREKARQEAAKIEAQRQAELKAERQKQAELAAELEAKKEAEIRAQKEKIAAELAAKKEAEKLAKAPIKKQLSVWVDSFSITQPPVQNELSKEIAAKFEAFKKWSQTQINNL
jgi:hypothetical protein